MDFVFVPGTTDDEALARRAFTRRGNTTNISLPRTPNIAAFLQELDLTSSITKPVGDLITAAHGNEEAAYFIALDSKSGGVATFEIVNDAVTSGSVRIPGTLVQQSGGGKVTITVRLRGCNIGKARPFIEKFRDAMKPTGGTLKMTAPLHGDEFVENDQGTYEHLAYQFQINRADQFANRAAALTEFGNAGFAYLNGTAITAADWDSWIPNDIHPRSYVKSRFYAQLQPAVGSATRLRIRREYRYDRRHFNFTISGKSDPGNAAGRIALLRTTLPLAQFNGHQLFDSNYPYPMYERYGNADVNKFIDNWHWDVDPRGGSLKYRGTRHDYTLVIPVADPVKDPAHPSAPAVPTLVSFNFYPAGSGSPAQVNNLNEADATLFLSL